MARFALDRRSRTASAAALFASLVSLGGCHKKEAASAEAPLRLVVAPEILTLDPHRQTSHGGLSALGNVYEALTTFDDQMRVVPSLATRWENPDELTWRFHLRGGVLFHDGRPLGVDDVVASLNRARRSGSATRAGLASIRDVAALHIDLVEVRTSRPNPMLLNNLATAFVVPRDAPKEIVAPIGSGPYRFVSFQPTEGLELAAWDRHWRVRPAVSPLSFRFEADPERRRELLASGAADVAFRLPESASEEDAGRARYRLVHRSAPGARVLGLRVDAAPFSDARVRRAISLAIDRSKITRELLGSHASPMNQMLTPGIFGYVPEAPAPARDLEAARRLLARASSGRGFAVTLDHGAGRRAEAEALATQLGEAGLRVTLRVREVPDLMPSLDSGAATLVLMSYVYQAGDAVAVFENILHSRDAEHGFGGENRFGYSNPEVDRLIEAAATAETMEARLVWYQQAMRLVMDDLPIVPLWEVSWVYGIRDEVEWTPPAHGWFIGASAGRR